jgi:hypothetical protein
MPSSAPFGVRIRLGMGGVDPDVLVEREAAHVPDVDALDAGAQRLVDGQRRRPGREPQHDVGTAADEVDDLVGDEGARCGGVGDDDDFGHGTYLLR